MQTNSPRKGAILGASMNNSFFNYATVNSDNMCNMEKHRIYWHGLLVQHLNVVSHWCFHAPVSERKQSEEFWKSVKFLQQYHSGILRLFINYAFDYTSK